MRQARRKKVLSEEGGRKEARGNKKKNKHLARHALQVCHTSLGTKICSQAVSLMPRPRPGRSGGDLGQQPQHGRAQRKLFLCCQEVPKKVVASRQLPKPPLQRGAGKGSEIPRKTQLRDSSYLVKRAGLGFVISLRLFQKPPWERRDGEKKRSSENRAQVVAHHSRACSPQPVLFFSSVFHPERSSHLIGFTLCSARREESTRREAAGSTERPRRVGREREEEAPEDSRG